MKRILLFTLLSAGLLLARPCFSQSMSNTDNILTLSNTCINAGVIPGTYNMVMHYSSDAGTFTVTASVSVSLANGILTIQAAAGTFPTPATTGYWSMPDTYNGDITLSSGSFSNLMFWALDNNYVEQFNCVALPIYFSSFSGSLSGSSVVLNWHTGTEQNVSSIEIYRSSTGSNYYKIAGVAPTGGGSTYSYTDNNPDASNYYYLKMASSVGAEGNYSQIVHVNCPSCHYTPPTPVNCPYTISGPDHLCTAGTHGTYSLSSAVPNYSTIVWSVNDPSAASLHTYPSIDRTRVSLVKKNAADADLYLTATMSGCSNVIQKEIAIGTPTPTIYTDMECPYVVAYPQSDPGATSFQWTLTNVTTVNQSYATGSFFSPYIGDGSLYDIGLTYVNVCGTSNIITVGNFYCEPGTSYAMPSPGPVVSPNPSNGIVTIGLPSDPPAGPTGPISGVPKKSGSSPVTSNVDPALKSAAANSKMQIRTAPNTLTTPVVKPKIYMVKVMDAQGVVRKTFSYPGGEDKVSVDLGGLNNGIYTVQVFDKKTWKSSQVVLVK